MAKINEEDIELLREKADLVDLVSTYSSLKKTGGHSFKGLCPFHSEKTPSFTVDTAKGLFYCFGCGEGGNAYTFVQKMENLPFPEAVEWLARRTGYELRYEESRPGERRASGIKMRVIEANNEAAAFCHRTLMSSPDALEARRYLSGRGFDKEVAERWQLGYAPGRDAICKHLLSRGFDRELLIQADLVRVSERDGGLYDSFRQRITFPTWNLQGEVVGFGARALGDQQPKYLNTSETPAFSKSRVMYGLDRAKSAIARGSAVVVEGYTDVIALHEAGIQEAVATNGVALGETHFELLKKFSSRAVLMFDADEAGKGATERGFGIHHRIGLEVLVAPLPDGRDPAEVVQQDGPEAIRKVIEGGRPLLEFKIEQTLERVVLDTPEARSAAVRETAQVLGLHPDPIARHEYAFMVASRIGVDVEVVQRALAEVRVGTSEPAGGTREADRRFPGHVKVEREALRLLLTHGRELAAHAAKLRAADFTSAVRREVFEAATSGPDGGIADLQRLSPDAVSLYTELSVGAQTGGPEGSEEAVEVFSRLRLFSLERAIKEKQKILHDIDPVAEPQRHDGMFTELVGMQAEKRDLLKRLQGDDA